MEKAIKTITWNNFVVQTNYHPEMPAGSPPGLPTAYNQWNPANVKVVGSELQLSIERNSPVIWQGQHVWAAAEAVIQRPAKFGTYCCTFRIVDSSGVPAWSQFNTGTQSHPNAQANTSTTFGIFLYDAQGGGGSNANSEIDFLELGFQNQANNGTGWIAQQPGGPVYNNAQFTLQPWDAGNSGQPNWNMVRRINVDVSKIPSSGHVTVLCQWTAAAAPINFYLAYGGFTSSTFPFASAISYTTPAAANGYVPGLHASTRLHLNLWPYGGPDTDKPVYCRISHLEMPS